MLVGFENRRAVQPLARLVGHQAAAPYGRASFELDTSGSGPKRFVGKTS